MTIKLPIDSKARLIEFSKAGRMAWVDGNLVKAERCFLAAKSLK